MCCKLRNKQYKVLKEWLDYVIDWCSRCFKIAMQTLGPLMFASANLLAGSVIYILLFILTPPLYTTNKLFYGIQLMFIIWGTINIYFNYWACMLTTPGSPDICTDPSTVLGTKMYSHSGEIVSKSVTVVEIEPDVSYRYCRMCPCIKPPRAHHCRYVCILTLYCIWFIPDYSMLLNIFKLVYRIIVWLWHFNTCTWLISVSGRCILNMDHFCPWMCNCVGYRNYRYFVLFLLYMCMGSFYVVCFTLTEMVKMTPRERYLLALHFYWNFNVMFWF